MWAEGEPEEDGYEDQYQLEDADVTAADYIVPVAVSNWRYAFVRQLCRSLYKLLPTTAVRARPNQPSLCCPVACRALYPWHHQLLPA